MEKSIIYQIALDCESLKSSTGFQKYLDYLNTDLNNLIFDLNNELLNQFAGNVAVLLNRENSGIHSVNLTVSSFINTEKEVPDYSISYINIIPSFVGIEFKVTHENEHKIENCVLDVIFNYLNTLTHTDQLV